MPPLCFCVASFSRFLALVAFVIFRACMYLSVTSKRMSGDMPENKPEDMPEKNEIMFQYTPEICQVGIARSKVIFVLFLLLTTNGVKCHEFLTDKILNS